MDQNRRQPLQFGLGWLFRLTVAVALLFTALTAELWVVSITTHLVGLATIIWVASLFKHS